MLQTARTLPKDLDRLIRGAMDVAKQTGQSEVVARLESALHATSSVPEQTFEVDVLASEVRVNGSVTPLSRGERMLLVALALLRKPATRGELIDRLYPHLDEITAGTQLKVYVHRVRRRLADAEVIVQSDGAYRLGPKAHVDFWNVENEVASALRSKGALSSKESRRMNEIRARLLRRDLSWTADREWCDALRRRLEAMLVDVTTRLGESALALGDYRSALRFAAEIFEIDGCDERAAELAVRAHVATGERDAAIRVFRRYERLLREEFSAKPSPQLAAIIA